MPAGIFVFPGAQPSRNLNGGAVVARLRFYVDLTTDPKNVFTDDTLTTPHPFPLESDDAGRFPTIWAETDELYTVAWDTDDNQTRTITGMTASDSADTIIAQETQAAADAAEAARDEVIAALDDVESFEENKDAAEAAAATATAKAAEAVVSADEADDARALAEYWAGVAQSQAGGDFQAHDATLDALAALATAANKLIYATGSDAFATTDLTSVARTLLAQTTQALMRTTGLGLSADGSSLVAAANYAAMRGLLDLEAGTDFNSYSAVLETLKGASANGQSLITAANYAAMVTALGLAELSNAELWTGADTAKVLTARRLFAAAASVSVTDAATITLDGNTGINFHVTLGGNRTFANPSNFKAGQSGRIRITQDATGSRTASWGTRWDFPGNVSTLSTAAGAVDVVSYFVHDAAGSIEATLIKALG